MARRAKIVATLGPATDSPGMLDRILKAGMDVARINFSHVKDEETPLRRIAEVREAATRLGKNVAILADLPGPKLRVDIKEIRTLTIGDTVYFPLPGVPLEPDDILITDPEVLTDLQYDHRILFDDGKLQLRARTISNGRMSAIVTVGGVLKLDKGMNLPDTTISIPAITDRDRKALSTCAKAQVDWLAMSFVRGPTSADYLRDAASAVGLAKIPVLAKIERPEAVLKAKEIIDAFDGVMVARGDLGVELPFEKLPPIQKMIIAAARLAGKPVITATEMLDSMTKNPRPTRAEVSDVANAVFDGTDAVMLSGETSVGDYPFEAVQSMAGIVEEAESSMRSTGSGFQTTHILRPTDIIEDSLALAACHLASEVHASAIITPTLSGRTARMLARYRPAAKIIAPVPNPQISRRLAVVWGVNAVPMMPLTKGDGRMVAAVRDAFNVGAIKVGDRVVVLAGHPIEGDPRMPTLRVVKVGEGGASLEP
ncbi:MAG: pyruvate kinase [Fimbriiglobus sp.]